jgi:uncharacterized membrane protein YccC
VGATIFETVMLRLQQTTLGIVVYILVAVLVWPRLANPILKQTVRDLVDVQRQLLAGHLGLLAGTAEDGEAAKLRAQATATVARLPAIVDGAELDDFEVWESRHLWRQCVGYLVALNEAMERWRQGFPELEKLDLQRLMPDLQAVGAELETRLASVTQMLAGTPPQRWPEEVAFALDDEALGSVNPFDRAALVRSADQLRRIDTLTRALHDGIADICGFAKTPRHAQPAGTAAPAWAIDPDRLASAVRAFVAVWIVLLACIYVPDFPMPGGVIPVVAAVALQLGLMPEFPVRSLVLPSLGSVAFAGVFHVLVMPHLAGFVELGLGIFIAIFLICVLYAKPEQAMVRGIGTSLFVMVISVENEQSYDILFVINFGLMFQLALLAIWISNQFPISADPQQMIFNKLDRFLRSCEKIAKPLRQGSERDTGWFSRMRHAFHMREVASLPIKIGRSVEALPTAALGEGERAREPAQALVNTLQALGDRVRELVEVREAPQSAAMVGEVLADMRAWRLGIQAILGRLAVDPASSETTLLRSQLDAKLVALGARIERALNSAPEGSVSSEEIDNMYRVLGAYRGVSEAVIDLARAASGIDWARLREARF